MNKKIGPRQALIHIFKENKNKKLSLKEIYSIFPKYYELTDFQKKPSAADNYKRPKYKNMVRSSLYKLVKEGIVVKHSFNCYYFSKRKP